MAVTLLTNLTYYTDGACSGNPGPGGFGIIRLTKIYENNKEQLMLPTAYSEYHQDTTNNRMEMMAVIQVLKWAKKNFNYHYTIFSDSAYVVNMCNDWIWKWQAAGWTRAKGKPIENLDLVKELYSLLSDKKIFYEIRKCSGHSGILENELADALASANKNKFNKLVADNKIEVTNLDFLN